MTETLSPDAFTLITTFEGCSKHPEWPGEQSGVTIGYGIDLGQAPKSLAAWTPYLSPSDYGRLAETQSVKGEAAKPLAAALQDIIIDHDDALKVLNDYTIPQQIAITRDAYPGANALPADSFGALVSLIYNRGPSMTGSKRTEMATIKTLIAAGPDRWVEIILQLAKMVPYWNNGVPTASNLAGRRLAEASLFARGMREIGKLPNALIKGDKSDKASPIAALQKALKIGADGDFGSGTMLAVWNYQKTNAALADSGVADTATRTALKV